MLVLLKVCDSPMEAHLIKSKLESEDVECILFNENIHAVYASTTGAFGGVKIMVDESDFIYSEKILKEIQNESDE